MANTVLRACGTGAFHCGVEVHDREWSYEGVGVFCCWPKRWEADAYFESLEMGITMLSEGEVLRVLEKLEAAEWTGPAYDILLHNCCHFSNALLQCLGVASLPDWVTNLAVVAATVRQTTSCWDCCSLD